MNKKVFLIRWYADDNVWRAFSSEDEAQKFVDHVNACCGSSELEVWMDIVRLD